MATVGREAVDVVDVRFLHLLDELPGVGRHAVEEAALAFGEEDVEGEGRLAGAAEAGDDDELVAGDVEVDVLQVVLAGAGDADVVVGGRDCGGAIGSAVEESGVVSAASRAAAGGRGRGEELAGVAFRDFGDFFRGAGGDDLPAVVAGFGAEVDDVVGALDDLEVVLDDEEGVAGVDEAVEDVEEHGRCRRSGGRSWVRRR